MKKIFKENSSLQQKDYTFFISFCNEITKKYEYFNHLPEIIILLYIILGNELDLLGCKAEESYRIFIFWGEFGENLRGEFGENLKSGNSFKKTLQRIVALILFSLISFIIFISAIYFIPRKIYNDELFQQELNNRDYLKIITIIISIPLGPLIYLALNNKSSYEFCKNQDINLKNLLDSLYKTVGAVLAWVAQIILSPFFLIISFVYEIAHIIANDTSVAQKLFQNIFTNIKHLIKFSLIIYIPLASISLCLGASYILTPAYFLANILLGHLLAVSNQAFLIKYILINSNFIFLWYKHNPQIFNKESIKQFVPFNLIAFLLVGFSIVQSNSLFIFLSILNQIFVFHKNSINQKNQAFDKPTAAFILEIMETNPENITEEDISKINQQYTNETIITLV
jgi:hypothetical protein